MSETYSYVRTSCPRISGPSGVIVDEKMSENARMVLTA